MFVSVLDRIARHWFLFFFVFGAYCAMISGVAGVLYGVPNLFLDDPALRQYGQLALFSNGPIFLSQLAASTLIGMIWLMVSLIDAHRARENVVFSFVRHFNYLLPRVTICSLFPLMAAAYALTVSPADTSPADFGRAMVGSAAGIVFVVINLAAAHFVNQYLKVPIVYLIMALVVAFLIVLTLVPKLIPAISIAIVLGWMTAIYGLINLLSDGLRPVAVLGTLAFIITANGTAFKYDFDGIKNAQGHSYYSPGKRVELYKDTGSKSAASEAGAANFFQRKIIQRRLKNFERALPELLDPLQTLRAWKRQTGLKKPKLVVISTSGGAYRAAFWTSLILDRLGSESARGGQLPGFDRHITLITGASGGMVAGAYFAAGRQRSGAALAFNNIEAQLQADIEKTAKADRFGTRFPIPRDSLSTVTQQLVQRDLLHLFNPFTQRVDRGKVLESHWQTLDLTFAQMKRGEREGWRPSIIFSPMIVETGQPLLISNLNLSEIRVESPQTLAYDGRALTRDAQPQMNRERRLRETVEFFKLFPGADKSFRLNTAARMSASFAYISPAVELPTIPARRVVDAGYYDNYGVSIAIAYLKQKEIKEWIEANTSGVMVVQIRAYPSVAESEDEPFSVASETPRSMTPEKARCEEIKLSQILSHQPGWLDRAFHFITSPLEGRETARQASMLFRNNQELRLLQSLYEPGFLHTVSFENASAISLNWYLPQHELRCLREELGKRHNIDALNALIRFWQSAPNG